MAHRQGRLISDIAGKVKAAVKDEIEVAETGAVKFAGKVKAAVADEVDVEVADEVDVAVENEVEGLGEDGGKGEGEDEAVSMAAGEGVVADMDKLVGDGTFAGEVDVAVEV